jgi:acetolactate synthase I/II/III large subunit
VSWSEGATPAAPVAPVRPTAVAGDVVDAIAKVLRGGELAALLLGGRALRADGLVGAARIAAASGAKVLSEAFPTRIERGAGLPVVERLAYFAEMATAQLSGLRHLVLVDAKAPVAFFAYPGKPSYLVPDGCEVHVLAGAADDVRGALDAVADALGSNKDVPIQQVFRPDRPSGDLTAETVCAGLGAVLPDGAIVSDEANTSGVFALAYTAGAPRHDWLTLTGGAIGQGLPVATGAAIAAPNRPVIALQADGSALYTIQALWTQARESLDVTTILLNNRSYSILNLELSRINAEASNPAARALLDLSRPDMDFVSIATGLGVAASRAQSAEDFTRQLVRAIAEPGPHLIEAVIPPLMQHGWMNSCDIHGKNEATSRGTE